VTVVVPATSETSAPAAPVENLSATPLVRAIGMAVRASGRLSTLRRRRSRRTAEDVRRARPMVVAEVTPEAADVVSVRLASIDGAALPAWSPGEHIDLVLPSGRVRQYSLCGDPADRGSYRIGVRQLPDGGGGSVEVHTLTPGASVTVRGPRQAFPLLSAPRYLFIAGGIGITPILPMVRAAAAAGLDWRLVYAGRDRASMPFLDELAAYGDRVLVRADDEHGGPGDGAELLRYAPGPGTVGYCCGPPPMLASVRAAMGGSGPGGAEDVQRGAEDVQRGTEDVQRGWVDVLHAERFAAPPVVGGRALTVELSRTGATVAVPSDRPVLEVVREWLPDVAYSCRQGFCGTCKVRVLSGEVEHRDHALAPHERSDMMTICVSRAVGDRLVLDL
jgi:ferredoxin-NADP reductase/ferredoxin